MYPNDALSVAAQGSQAMHYAHFVRALVPRSWLVLAAQDATAEDRQDNARRHFYQGHALRPWNDKADGLRLEFFTDYPFELPDFVVHQKPSPSGRRPVNPQEDATHLSEGHAYPRSSSSRAQYSSTEQSDPEHSKGNSPRPAHDQNRGHRWRIEDEFVADASLKLEQEHSDALGDRARAGTSALHGCCRTEACSWTVTLQARSLEEQDTYMEQHTISPSRTAYPIDECILLKGVVARRFRQNPRQLTCISSFDDEGFVSAYITVQTHAGVDVRSLMGLVQHTMLTPVGEVSVESTCHDNTATPGEAASDTSS